MSRARTALAVLVTVATVGSLAVIVGYGWYLRSGLYRARCAAALSAAIGLPADIGRVAPRSLWARDFYDITVWLPQRRGRALHCERATLSKLPDNERGDMAVGAYEIAMTGGGCEISARTWLADDYRGVFASGLRSGFSPDGPRRVTFGDMDVVLRKNGLQAQFHDAAGYVDFADPLRAHASIVSRRLNDHATAHPVHLAAEIVPWDDGVRIERLELVLPEVPLEALHLADMIGLPVCSGSFHGQVAYTEHDGGATLTLAGACTGLELPEVTRGLVETPWRGRCERVTLHELRVENGVPTRLRFAGRLAGVHLDDVLPGLGLPDAGEAIVDLDVGVAHIERDRIVRLVASGRARDLSLERLTSALGRGTMSGRVQLRITDLTIEDNRLSSLDAVVRVEPSERQNWIESDLLEFVVWQVLKVDLPPILPERLEYSELGVRLEVRDEQLVVYGTHGVGGRTILTARLFGADVPLVSEPRGAFDLRPWLDRLRAMAHAQWRPRRHTRGPETSE